jgi:hypothetical protein
MDGVECHHAVKGPVREGHSTTVSANKIEIMLPQGTQYTTCLSEHGVVVVHAGQVQTLDFAQQQVGVAAGADADVGAGDLTPVIQLLLDKADGFDVRRPDLVVDRRNLRKVFHYQNIWLTVTPRDDLRRWNPIKAQR